MRLFTNMRKRNIVLILLAGFFIIGLGSFHSSVSSPTVSIAVIGTTNVSRLPLLVLVVTNSGPMSIHCLGAFTVRPLTGSSATVSTSPVHVPPHGSVMISCIPTSLFTNSCSILAPWEVSWRWHLQQWTKSAGFIPTSIRDKVPKYHVAKSAEYVP